MSGIVIILPVMKLVIAEMMTFDPEERYVALRDIERVTKCVYQITCNRWSCDNSLHAYILKILCDILILIIILASVSKLFPNFIVKGIWRRPGDRG